jgi:hypothetical protein
LLTESFSLPHVDRLVTPASTPTTTLERWHVAALWTDANLPALHHPFRWKVHRRLQGMIDWKSVLSTLDPKSFDA